MEIRYLRESDDRLAISKVYEESWKYVYKGIVPKEYLDSIQEGAWVSCLDTEGRYTLVMTDGQKIVGTSSFCRSRMTEMANYGEIISIYLLPEYMGKRYGRLLLNAVIHELKNMGFEEIFLWVLEDNHRARKFYEKSGFRKSNQYIEDCIGGKRLKEVQYCYELLC